MAVLENVREPVLETLCLRITPGDPLAFEKAFHPWLRNTVCTCVLNVVRAHRRMHRELTLEELRHELLKIAAAGRDAGGSLYGTTDTPGCRDVAVDTLGFWQGFYNELEFPSPDLWRYLEFRQRWDRLPPKEQESIKRRSRTGVATAPPMDQRPPSRLQLQCLTTLGYHGEPPTSMLDASTLINTIKTRRGIR